MEYFKYITAYFPEPSEKTRKYQSNKPTYLYLLIELNTSNLNQWGLWKRLEGTRRDWAIKILLLDRCYCCFNFWESGHIVWEIKEVIERQSGHSVWELQKEAEREWAGITHLNWKKIVSYQIRSQLVILFEIYRAVQPARQTDRHSYIKEYVC